MAARWFAGLAIISLLAGSTVAGAAATPWSRYDNPFFTAYSNASERTVRGLLQDLEEFRAAVLQVANVQIPVDAPTTLVLITANKKEFDRLKPSQHTAGYAIGEGGRTVIVLPASGGDAGSTVIRHEYGHALLRFKKFRYPTWYEEGFAEIASAVELKRGGERFIVGAPPKRAVFNGVPIFPWEELFSEDFAPHAIGDLRDGSSAYAQAWLMAHYATLGDRGANAERLQRYFDLTTAGEPYLQAFRMAFGFEPSAAWDSVLRAYSERIPAYTFTFQPGSLHTRFSRRAADTTEYQPLVNFLARMAVARFHQTPPSDPLAALRGRWAPNTMSGRCEDAVEFRVEGETVAVVLQDGDASDAASRYRWERDGDEPGGLSLTPLEPASQGATPMALALRSHDVACWWPRNDNVPCQIVLVRCGVK